MPVRQTELERGVLGVLLGVALGALVGLLARRDDDASNNKNENGDGGRWAASFKI